MPQTRELTERIAQTAIAAARAAGKIQADQAGSSLQVDRKMAYDVKLEVDRLSEKAIVSKIRNDFPQHDILAEEAGETQAAGEYRWIIDPLDGTVNYFYGLPYYCTSISCFRAPALDHGQVESFEHLGQPVAGVVYCAATDELFLATEDGPCLLNGSQVTASSVETLAEALVVVGYGNTESARNGLARATNILAGRVRKIRCLGAAAYDLANVAAGRVSVFFEKGLRTWDIAAGGLLVQQAGGVFRATQYAPTSWRVFAAGPKVSQEAYREFLTATEWDDPAGL